jgi:hypothetical protein
MDLKTMNEHFLTIEICVLSAVLVICGFAFFSRNRSGTRFAISNGYALFKWDFIGPILNLAVASYYKSHSRLVSSTQLDIAVATPTP